MVDGSYGPDLIHASLLEINVKDIINDWVRYLISVVRTDKLFHLSYADNLQKYQRSFKTVITIKI